MQTQSSVHPHKRRRLSADEGDSQSDEEPSVALRSTTAHMATPTHTRNITFATLEVAPWLVASLAAMAIKRPTGIQRGCIPEILAGRDCIGGSRTGSGKTVAFAVPILHRWAQDPTGIYAVVLTPTRSVPSV